MKSLIIFPFISLFNIISAQYGMGEYITCWENNKFSYSGFHDPGYAEDPDYIAMGGEGDVCDHTDSTWNEVRDMCYFQVQLEDETWTYKCMHHNECPIKDENGTGTVGCKNVTNKRITCCCQEDYCNGEQYYGYALLGYPATTEEPTKTTEAGGIGEATTTKIVEETEALTYQPITATHELCYITGYNSTECSCGGSCTATETEYFATVESKCGDKILRTGQYGLEDCDPENLLRPIHQIVPCLVLPCEEGEFKFIDASNPLLSTSKLFVFTILLSAFYMFVY